MEAIASAAPKQRMNTNDEKRPSQFHRFQLLRYREVERLREVMETVVPIHGTGNFPTLDIKPSRLVQLVRERLESIGIQVKDVRLNGSAATHVLSGDTAHSYKDLDLLFAIDFPNSVPTVMSHPVSRKLNHKNTITTATKPDSIDSPEDGAPVIRPSSFPADIPNGTSCLSPVKDMMDDSWSVDDSGYTSSGSSVNSIPPSPRSFAPVSSVKPRKRLFRSRKRSFESTSSTSSAASTPFKSRADEVLFLNSQQLYFPDHHNWQGIKDVTMDVLLEFLPPLVNRTNMNSIVLRNAYVQKMVKVSNDVDKWSLISLNNNSGRNLELKFVQNMKRQYEFSVDSFQIILDSYLSYCKAEENSDSSAIMSETFYPTVLAESVYGDFTAALRHLKLRQICTHRPEEIRGGGLLRYCNLLAREFTPGDEEVEAGSTDANTISRLEQHMCSRFFIDFSDIEVQQKKLLGYLNSHFHGEDELKFQYLLLLRRVVDTSTICLMHHERTLIINFITMLARQSLANNLNLKLHDRLSLATAGLGEERSENPRLNSLAESNAGSAQSHDATAPKEFSSSTLYSGGYYFWRENPFYSPLFSDSSRRSVRFQDVSYQQSYYYPCNCQYCQSYYYAPSTPSSIKVKDYPMLAQPIFYDPAKMTCIYKPAGYGDPAKA